MLPIPVYEFFINVCVHLTYNSILTVLLFVIIIPYVKSHNEVVLVNDI